MLFAGVSSNQYDVGDILERERLELSVGRVIKSETEGSWTYVGRNSARSCYQKLRSITKLLLGHDILKKKTKKKKEQQKEKCDFLKIFFLWIFELSC